MNSKLLLTLPTNNVPFLLLYVFIIPKHVTVYLTNNIKKQISINNQLGLLISLTILQNTTPTLNKVNTIPNNAVNNPLYFLLSLVTVPNKLNTINIISKIPLANNVLLFNKIPNNT